MAKKLRALSVYTNGPRNLTFTPQQEFDASDELAAFLLADAPGSFEEVTEEVKAVEAPPVDKMVKRPKASK